MSKSKIKMKIRTIIDNNDRVIDNTMQNKKTIKTIKKGYINIQTSLNITSKRTKYN